MRCAVLTAKRDTRSHPAPADMLFHIGEPAGAGVGLVAECQLGDRERPALGPVDKFTRKIAIRESKELPVLLIGERPACSPCLPAMREHRAAVGVLGKFGIREFGPRDGNEPLFERIHDAFDFVFPVLEDADDILIEKADELAARVQDVGLDALVEFGLSN